MYRVACLLLLGLLGTITAAATAGCVDTANLSSAIDQSTPMDASVPLNQPDQSFAFAPVDFAASDGDAPGAPDLSGVVTLDLAGQVVCTFDDPNSDFDSCVISP